jgi:ABC-type lipoprotein release transport system permease subunit
VEQLAVSWQIVIQRIKANWRLMLALFTGMLVASVLLGIVPVYGRAMADVGLTYRLRETLREDNVITLQIPNLPAGTEDLVWMDQYVTDRAQRRLGDAYAATETEGGSMFFRLNDEPQDLRVLEKRLTIVYKDGVESKLLTGSEVGEEGELIGEATLPQFHEVPPIGEGDPPRLEVALTPPGAATLDLEVGDRFEIVTVFADCLPPPDPTSDGMIPPQPPCDESARTTLRTPAVLTALVLPADGEDPYWRGQASGFLQPFPSIAATNVPLLVSREAFVQQFGAAFNSFPVTVNWNVEVDVEGFNSQDIDGALAQIEGLRQDIREQGGIVFSKVEDALVEFQSQLSVTEAPILLIMLQVVAIVLFYVALVGSLVLERDAEEVALLKSRGAGTTQVLGIYLLQGLTLALPAALIGAFLAPVITSLLGYAPVFDDVTNGEALPFRLLPETFVLAGAGALLAVVAMLIPAFFFTRRSFLDIRERKARPPSVSIIHRYYLDVGLVAIALLLLYELDRKDSVFDAESIGGLSSDPLLLMAPAVMTVAAAAIFLRLFPLLLRLFSRVFLAAAGVAAAIGMLQMVRNPSQYTRLGLLLLMVVAVGAFAASYGSTIERSYEERARYEVGSDLRYRALGQMGNLRPAETEEQIEAVPGVDGAGVLIRMEGTLGNSAQSSANFRLLGVDPAQTAEMLWWREDFSDASLSDLMAELTPSALAIERLTLPQEPATLSLWVNPTAARPDHNLWIRLRDAEGRVLSVNYGKLGFQGWRQLTVDLEQELDVPVNFETPVTIQSIYLSEPDLQSTATEDPIYFDDLVATDASGREVVLDDFEGDFLWGALLASPEGFDGVEKSTDESQSGSGSAKFTFRKGRNSGLRGMVVTSPYLPMPAIVSDSFMAATGFREGNEFRFVIGSAIYRAVVHGSAKYFPTLDPAGRGFVILNLEHLAYQASMLSEATPVRANEAFVSVSSTGQAREETMLTLSGPGYGMGQRLDVEEMLAENRADPLISAGGQGILTVAFIGVFTVLAAGYVVTLFVAADARKLEVSVLRTLGLSNRQILGLMTFEYGVILLAGTVLGLFLGLQIADTMLSFLEVDQDGLPVLPDFVVTTDWRSLGIALAAMFVVAVGGIFAVTSYFVRLPVSRIVRVTQ